MASKSKSPSMQAGSWHSARMTQLRYWSPNIPGIYATGAELEKAGTKSGGVVSELGEATEIPTWFGKCAGYVLRPSRIRGSRYFTHHGFGQAYLGNAWTSPRWNHFALPAVGSRIILKPEIPSDLAAIVGCYQSVIADCTWGFRADIPLGASFQLRIFAPEVNATATTRGFAWKPGTVDTVAAFVGWSSPSPRFHKDSATKMKGHPGLAIAVECVQDNSSEDVSVPINIQYFCWVHNVHCYSSVEDNAFTELEAFNFQAVEPPPPPTDPPEPLFGEFQADSEVPASGDAGAVGDSAEVGISNDTAKPADEPGPPETIQTAKPPVESGEAKPVPSKPQASAQNQKWFKYRMFQLTSANMGKVNVITIKPSTMTTRGDSPGVPFRRNVFAAGGYAQGLCTGLEVKIVSHRAPTIAGTIACHTNGSHPTSHVRYHVLGGDHTIIPLQPDQYVDTAGLKASQNRLVSPWIRTSAITFSLGLKYQFLNRTQSVGDPWITIYIRPGATRFNVPVKPKPAPTSSYKVDELLAKDFTSLTLRDVGNIGDILASSILEEPFRGEFQSSRDNGDGTYSYNINNLPTGLNEHDEMSGLKYDVVWKPTGGVDWDKTMADPANANMFYDGSVGDATDGAQMDPDGPTAVTGPVGILAPYEGIAAACGDADKLSQDDTWIRVANFDIPTDGKIVAITLPLWELKDEATFSGSLSPAHEKCERHMELEPVSGGVFGPTIGHYQIKIRPPAGVTADIAHVAVPPELNDEAALRIFGLDSLLSLAGNALQSVGGSLLGGAIDTVGNILGSTIDSFLGGRAADTRAPETRAPGITGDIPITRYAEFVRTLKDSNGSTEYWPTLMAQAYNVFTNPSTEARALTTIPASVYVRMCNVPVRRNVYDRNITYEPVPPTLTLKVDREAFGSFLYYLGQTSSPRAKILAQKALTVLSRRSFPYDLARLEDEAVPTKEQYLQAMQYVSDIARLPRSHLRASSV